MSNDTRPNDRALFEEFAASRDRRLRNRLVEAHMGLAIHLARRFARNRGSEDDIRQVALLGLVKAVERFDPARQVAFSTFAGRTIEGEIKRHFRDKTWAVRVPRSMKELHLRVRGASESLSQQLGRSPTVAELAEHLEVSTDEIIEAIGAGAAYSAESLDAPAVEGGVDRAANLAEDASFADVEDRHVIRELIDRLPERERLIVELRFYEELSQSEIAERVGISQMHVSRLLRRSFKLMRSHAGGSGHDPEG